MAPWQWACELLQADLYRDNLLPYLENFKEILQQLTIFFWPAVMYRKSILPSAWPNSSSIGNLCLICSATKKPRKVASLSVGLEVPNHNHFRSIWNRFYDLRNGAAARDYNAKINGRYFQEDLKFRLTTTLVNGINHWRPVEPQGRLPAERRCDLRTLVPPNQNLGSHGHVPITAH